ncbi:ABC transporter substrate-binding protein [Streptomyces sp. NPDC050418]|uniref:ABC transporter substrate-binding protein n=1 Tax=Streptomyces sp. NPDC050418 TaxID=3365612 RepID=UPI0037BC3570
MFNRALSLRTAAAMASISLVAGCGLVSSGDSEEEKAIVVGTTSAPTTLDPAAAWDGSWELYRNVYQTLVSFPAGAAEPQPDAAEKCRFTDRANRTYACELRDDMKFSDGDAMNAAAVKHSIDRILEIGVKGGPKPLLGSLEKVETRGEKEVIFHLKKSDATFPFVLATPAMSIVDPDDYKADEVREGRTITGSGPYLIESYNVDGDGRPVEAVLAENPHYKGAAERKNSAVTIKYFADSATMVEALKTKQIDLTFRGLASSDIVDLDADAGEGLQITEGAGMEIRYLVFTEKDRWTRNPAVRKAVAQLIDRAEISHDVYEGTVEPLYSMVPKGVTGHTAGFFDAFGKPDAAKAKEILTKAGIFQKVPLTLWYTTDRYGSGTKQEFEEIKRQLDKSGLFEVTLKGRPWKTYEQGYKDGEYPVFGRGWFPDFPDPDNFIAPFVGKDNALSTPYLSPEITDELLPESRRESDRSAVDDAFERAQDIFVDDARLLPLWQGKQYIAASEEIAGSEQALDPSTIMMMWQLERKTSW